MPLTADYRPRDAEHAVLYRVIHEHLETFLETAKRQADGSPLPEFVVSNSLPIIALQQAACTRWSHVERWREHIRVRHRRSVDGGR